MPRSYCTRRPELPHYLRNADRRWAGREEVQLMRLIKQNTPTRVIGLKLGRSEKAIRLKAQRLGLSLKPVNRSPYGSRR